LASRHLREGREIGNGGHSQGECRSAQRNSAGPFRYPRVALCLAKVFWASTPQQQGFKSRCRLAAIRFANPSAVDRETLAKIEDEVNQRILAAEPVAWKLLPIAEARQAGAMMLFGEKYPDMVRAW